MFIAQIRCEKQRCLRWHRLTWDDVGPPDPAKIYCFTCPFTHALIVLKVDRLAWFLRGTKEATALEGTPVPLMEWDQRATGWRMAAS